MSDKVETAAEVGLYLPCFGSGNTCDDEADMHNEDCPAFYRPAVVAAIEAAERYWQGLLEQVDKTLALALAGNNVEHAHDDCSAICKLNEILNLLEKEQGRIEAAERRGAEREREACAQVVDRIVGPDDQFAAGFLAEAIRARSRTEGEHR